MAELPAWSGAVGSTLVKSADAFLQGMMGPSFEDERAAREEARLKALDERRRIQSQAALYEAEAEYNRRRGVGGGVIKTPYGVFRDNPVTGNLDPLLDYPDKAKKESEAQQLLTEFYDAQVPGAAPFPPAKRARLNMILMGLARAPNERGQLAGPWEYSGMRDPLSALTGSPPPTSAAPPPTAGGPPPTTAPVPRQEGGQPAPPPRPPPAPPGGKKADAPVPRGPAGKPSTPGRNKDQEKAFEQLVGVITDNIQHLTDSELQTFIDDASKRQATRPSNYTLAELEAIKRLQATRRSQSPTPPAESPPSVTPPATPPPQPPAVRQPPRGPTEETQQHERGELGEPKTSEERQAVTRDLHNRGFVDSPYFDQLTDNRQRVLVDAIVAEPKRAEEFRKQRELEIREADLRLKEDEAKRKAEEPVTKALAETVKERLSEVDTAAKSAAKMDRTFGQIETLITSKEGVYGNTGEGNAAMLLYRSPFGSTGDQRARNTEQLRNLASQLQLAFGSLGTGVSVYDAQVYAKAQGNMQAAKDVKEMLQYIEIMRGAIRDIMWEANYTRQYVLKHRELPPWGEVRTVTEAQVQQVMKDKGKTRDEVIEKLRLNRMRVQ